MSLPLQRIIHHKPVYYPGATRVYTIVKHRRLSSGESSHTFNQTFFNSIPVRDRKEGDVNCILSFICKEHAMTHCQALNNPCNWLVNNDENTASECKVDEYTLSDLSYYSWHLRMPMALMCNAYCEGSEREPHYDVMVIDVPIEDI